MASSQSVVTVDWLHEHLHDPNVAIADCRFDLANPEAGRQQYAAGHIPGAYYFDLNQDLSSPVRLHGGRHPLPDIATLARKLEQMGICSDVEEQSKLIVAYDASRLAYASRLWWLVRYLGYTSVAVLDGGFQAWQASSYPVTQVVPSPQAGQFTPNIQSQGVVNRQQVETLKDHPGYVLIDSREGDRYRGEREPIDPVAGHIPGAVNYPWQEATDAAGFVRSISEHKQRWQAITNAQDIMVYCGSGVTACVNLFSLHMAGLDGKLYAGSWSDWCSYPELPVATGDEPI